MFNRYLYCWQSLTQALSINVIRSNGQDLHRHEKRSIRKQFTEITYYYYQYIYIYLLVLLLFDYYLFYFNVFFYIY